MIGTLLNLLLQLTVALATLAVRLTFALAMVLGQLLSFVLRMMWSAGRTWYARRHARSGARTSTLPPAPTYLPPPASPPAFTPRPLRPRPRTRR